MKVCMGKGKFAVIVLKWLEIPIQDPRNQLGPVPALIWKLNQQQCKGFLHKSWRTLKTSKRRFANKARIFIIEIGKMYGSKLVTTYISYYAGGRGGGVGCCLQYSTIFINLRNRWDLEHVVSAFCLKRMKDYIINRGEVIGKEPITWTKHLLRQ